eukprot:CAMPEP_0194723624 /NCGR_PEP_ID=MMETSP0296-20130528/14602_1 /TAXON_ID=39354 /ORGANISM="Heterosigma akashiwo, Strain CCMP2393" /LENGTH=298 /DNA_ID=CAMNT_0039627101 /DNA_START=279 /DNA_END=1175 /DNA_ORIENTATION=+
MNLGLVEEFKTGLAIFCNMPTTIASGVALVGQAGGNSAQALLLTVATNLLGIVTVPFYLSFVLAAAGNIDISPVPLLQKLLITIFMPIGVGKGLQELSRTQTKLKFINFYFKKYKFYFKLLTNVLLAIIVWMGFSKSAASLKATPGLDVFLLVLAAVMLHVAMLAFNLGALRALRADRTHPMEYRATLIMASQKTLPFAVSVISFLDESVGEAGLITIPCILMHLSQLFVDAYVASYFGARPVAGGQEGAGEEEGGAAAARGQVHAAGGLGNKESMDLEYGEEQQNIDSKEEGKNIVS